MNRSQSSGRLCALLLAFLTLSPIALGLLQPAQAGVLDRTPPDPVFTVTPGEGTTATRFDLDARGSHVPSGTQVLVDWGDGTLQDGPLVASHQYARAGDFVVRLHLRNAELGDASAYALVRVRALEPAAWAQREEDALRGAGFLPNHVVLPSQQFDVGVASPGVVAVLVDGLDPTVLPLNQVPGGPSLAYVRCDEDACAQLPDLANLTDPSGVATGALSVLLQKVLNASYYAIDVRAPDGSVSLPALARGLDFARSLGPVAVLSLLPPDAGFLDDVAAVGAYDPDLQTGRHGDPGVLAQPERLAFLRALAANRARYDYGDNGTYPVPNGFNETRAPEHAHGYGGGHSHGSYGHGVGADVLDSPAEGCVPLPRPGPREDLATARIPTYERYEDSLKSYGGITGRDLQALSPVESAVLEAFAAYHADLACLHHVLSHLSHEGIPVVVPAGDSAYHVRATDAVNATWDLQTLRGLADFPQVITVGATTSDAYGAGGTHRVVLPTSAAGPARSLHGVKPDLVAPADVPGALVGAAFASGAWWSPEQSSLYDGFRYDRTGGLVLGNATVQGERLVLGPSDLDTGIVYTGSRDLAPRPSLNVSLTLSLPPGQASRNVLRLAAQEGSGISFANGFGLDIKPLNDGRVNVTSLVRVNGADYDPPCVAVCPPSVKTVTVDPAGGVVLRVTSAPSARAGHDLLTFEVRGQDGLTRATLAREMPVNATGSLCACRRVTFLSGLANASATNWTRATLDNVTVTGLSGPAQAMYGEDVPVGQYGVNGVRPSTRVAAAYAAGVAIVNLVPLLATEPDPVERLVRLRGALAGLATPLADVPPFVQGAGELDLDAPGTAFTLLVTEHQAPGVPGLDYGLRLESDRPSAYLEFHWSGYLGAHQVNVETSGVTWWRLDRDLRAVRVSESVGLAATSITQDQDTRSVWVNVTSLPAQEGVYAAWLPVGVSTAVGISNPLYAKTQIPVVVTRGVSPTVDLSALDAPVGASAWLLPPMSGRHLVYDPLPGGPAANGTLDAARKVGFGVVAPAGYSLALAVSASLPVPDAASPGGVHEAGRPRDLVVVSRALRPLEGVSAIAQLDANARLPVPVAFRFLDVVESAELSWRQADPRQTNGQILRGAANLSAGRWRQRGDARPAGHALSEPLPVGETVVGWDLRTVGRAPDLALGSQSSADARADYALALDAATYAPTALTGHLDLRPYGWSGATDLPALVLETSVAVPRPLDSLHGQLLLPLDVDEATVLLRVTAGDQSLTTLLTGEGAWVPGPDTGETWPEAGGDRWDDVPDFTAGGVLSGWGHLHARGDPGDLRLVPRAQNGYVVPLGFHDLPADLASVTVQLLLRPDPTGLAGRAYSTGPLDPVPGPRFRLDDVALYAWTTGTATRDGFGTAAVELGPTARFDLPAGAAPDPLHEPVVRMSPLHEAGEPVPEFIELYARSEADRLRLAGATVVASGASAGIARGTLVRPDAETLSFSHGRGVNGVYDPTLHPLGVLRPYGAVTPLEKPLPERFVAFASLGASLWRADAKALVQAAGPTGSLTLQFRDGGAVSAAPFAPLPARLPDMPDPSPPPAMGAGECAYDGVGLVGVLVGNLARLGCYRLLPEEGYGGPASVAAERQDAAVSHDAVTGASVACVDAEAADPCAGDVLEQVDTDAGTLWSRFVSLRDTLLGNGSVAAPGARTSLWEGTVPMRGALLVLEHRVSGSGSAALNATLLPEGVEHRLVTLEGQETFQSADPRLRTNRMDVFDLSGYAGQRVRVDLVKEGNPSWTVPAWRLLPLSTPAVQEPSLSPALLDASSALPRPSPVFRSIPSGTTVRAGPAQAALAATPGAGLVHLAAGLDVASSVKLEDRHLVVGRDVDEGAVLRVRSGATLTLDDLTLAPRSLRLPWGIVVEAGGVLRTGNVTLLGGGSPESGLAAIEVMPGGVAYVNFTDVLGGETGVRLHPGATLVSLRSTFARNLRAVDAEGATVTLLHAFVDGNVQGVVARNATVEVFGGLYTSNREGAIQLQDSLAAVSNATFAWNGEAGPRAALATYEGLDTGRVVLHDVRFQADALAILARAPLDAHDLTVKQAETALRVGPAAQVRIDHANVTSAGAPALFLDAGSVLYANSTTLKGAPTWADCGPVPPALVWTDRTTRVGADDPECLNATHVTGTNTDAQESRWRAVVARPWLKAGPNPVLLLPYGSDATLVDVGDGNKRANLTLQDGALTVQGPDRLLRVKAAPATGNPVTQAWGYDVVKDSLAPAGGLRLLAGTYLGEDGALYLRPASAALAVDAAEAGSGVAAHALLLDSLNPDGTPGARAATVLSALRGARAVLGNGAPAALAPVTGDRVTLTPLLRDRAGNAAPGSAVSVVYDRTPPRAWLHAANPCGDLFGYDVGWMAHDPRVGAGLRPAGVPPDPAQNWTYVLSVASVNLSATVGMGDIDTLVDIVDLGAADRLRASSPQALNAQALKELDRRLNDPLNGHWLTDLPLVDWIEVGRFTRDEEGIHLSTVRTLNDMLERNLNWTEARARELLASKNETDAWLQAIAEARLQDVDAHERVTVTLDQAIVNLEHEIENLRKLTPVILALRIEARDALGNTAYWYEPVLSDVLSPTNLFYFLGDNVRERVMPMLLAPSATVDLADLHGELTVLDPDCGLQDLTVLDRLPGNVTTPLATLYPREGRVTFDVFSVQDLFPANLCGPRTLEMRSTDVFGRRSVVTVGVLLDRVAPDTDLLGWRKSPLLPALPVLGDVQPPAVDPSWINEHGVEVEALSESLNLPACPSAWASIHDMAVEASVDNRTWVRLAQEHFGAARNGTLVNTTVRLNATAPIEAKDFGMTDAELSGRWVSARVLARDEAGNEETGTDATFGFRVDTKPPLCTLDHVEAQGGHTLPVAWTAQDVDQTVPGHVVNASLLMRPYAAHPAAGTDAEWIVYAWLPQPVGTANAVLTTSPLPAWTTMPILHDVDLACAAYDQAGNLGVGPAARTLLDLELPIVNWTTLEPAWSNAAVVFNWTVDEVVTGPDRVLVYANETGHDLVVRANFTADFNNTWTLDPVALGGKPGGMAAHDGENWTVSVEAQDKAGNRFARTHQVLFDTTPPSGNLTNVIQGLVGGFLPVDLFDFAPDLSQGTTLPQSPYAARLEVREGATTRTFTLGPDGKFHLSFASDGAKSMRLLPCDAAGNCGAPTAWVDFQVDLALPVTTLLQVAGGTLPTSTLPGGSVSYWVSDTASVSARFGVADANGQSSGIAGLRVRAVPLNSFTREPVPGGAILDATVTDLGVLGGVRTFSASVAGLSGNQLYRYEVSANDTAGNREGGAAGWRPLETYFAYDPTPPAAILGALAPYFNAAPVRLPITLRDDVNGIGVGVASYQVRVQREAAPANTSSVAPASNATWSNVTWSDTGVGAVDEGVLLTYCVVPKDRFGRAGSCDGSAQTVLDATPPTVSLVLPADARLDPWTNQLPVTVGVKVQNVAVGARAAPVTDVMLELATQDLTRPPSFRVDLQASGIVLGPNAEHTATFDIGASDGQIYLLSAAAADAAGNRRLPGQAAYRAENRNTTEWGLWSFDANDNANDVSGNGNALSFPGGSFNPLYYTSPTRGGRSIQVDGDAYLYRNGAMGLGGAMTAMAWVYPTAADQTAGILGRTQLGRDWGLRLEGGYVKATVETTTGLSNTLTSAAKLPLNQWSHVAMTYDGQFLRLLVDGASAAPQGPLSGPVSESAGASLMVGAAVQGATTRGLVGFLDEVRLYRTALSAADVRDLKDYPYWNGVAQTPLHVDATAPVSLPAPHDLLQALPTVNAYAYDGGPGKPSLVKSVRLEERVLDSNAYTSTSVAKEGWLEIAQAPGREILAGTEFRWTHPLRLPSYPATVSVRLAVNDSIPLVGSAPDCSPAESGIGNRARWRVLLGSADLGGRFVGATPFGDAVYHLNATTVSGPTDLVLAVQTTASWPWKACYPRLQVRFDDVTVRDAAGNALFADSMLAQGEWTPVLPTDSATASFAQASVPWSAAAPANARYAESWSFNDAGGWALQNGADQLAHADVVVSGVDGFAYQLAFEGTTGGASSIYDRAGRALPAPVDATHLFVSERTLREAATTLTRPGIQVDVGDSKSIVFTFEESLVGGLPTRFDALTGRTYYYVPVTSPRVSGQWNSHLLDLAAAKQALGVTGSVTGLYAYLEKQVTALPGQAFGASVALDDVKLLDGARARIDLPFRFPYYGKTYTTVYADVDGVLGFTPTFSAERTAAAFDGQRVVAPAWADWTLAGVDEADGYRPHGVYVDKTVHNQTTILWLVGAANAPGRTQAFALTLMETGEMLASYRTVPDAATLHRVGVSAGDGRKVDRTGALPSFTNAEDGYLPGDGVWRARDTKPWAQGLLVTPDLPLHLRTVAVDNADNVQVLGGARGKVTRDSQPPFVSVQPVLDYLGGLPNRDLRVLTTLLDNHTSVDLASVEMKVWDLSGASPPDVPDPALGENVTTMTPFDVVHRARYALNLSAKDRFGQLGWSNTTFQAIIKPEPDVRTTRPLDGAVLVDDVLVGATPGVGGFVGGDRFSASGNATVESGGLWLNVTLDGKLVASGTGPGAAFGTTVDAAGLSAGTHTYRVRAETPNGSFDEETYVFQAQNATAYAASDVENDTASWWRPSFPSGDQASALAEAARRGALGIRVRAVADAAYSAFAQYNLSTPAPAGRHWAFVRVPAAPTGGAFEVLRLEGTGATVFSARVDAKMVLWALSNGTWVNTTRSLQPDSWTKVEVKDSGSGTALYLDGAFAGSYARGAGAGPVRALVFAASAPGVAGDLHVDDVASDRSDVVRRLLLQDDFADASIWTPEWAGMYGLDPLGREGLALDSTPSAPRSVTGAFPAASPDLVVTLDVGLFDRGCSGEGDVARLLDVDGDTILSLACAGTALKASNGTSSATQPLSRALVSGKYNRIVLHVATDRYVVFLNDQLAGAYALASADPAAFLNLGGGDARLWYNDAAVFRGRLLLSDGFDGILSSAWRLPAGSATLSASASTAQSATATRSLKVSSVGGLNEQGWVERNLSLPKRAIVSARVYVPSATTFDDFQLLALGNASGADAGFVIGKRSATDPSPYLYARRSGTTATTPLGPIAPGWHWLSLYVDQASGTWTPYWNGAEQTLGEPLTRDPLTRLFIGDMSVAAGQGTVYVDDVQVIGRNTLPSVVLVSPASGTVAKGLVTIRGTAHDEDFGDAPESIDLVIDGTPVPVRNAPSWSYVWDTSALGGTTHSVYARAWQTDLAEFHASSSLKTYTVSTT